MPEIEAHITGTVWKIEVAVGDDVSDGDTVVILESMKMEMPVEVEDDGKVTEIRCESPGISEKSCWFKVTSVARCTRARAAIIRSSNFRRE
jgi:acetyl-CoA carboxylase biotin carboxyl carrier protein